MEVQKVQTFTPDRMERRGREGGRGGRRRRRRSVPVTRSHVLKVV